MQVASCWRRGYNLIIWGELEICWEKHKPRVEAKKMDIFEISACDIVDSGDRSEMELQG